jgi:hypothetical protein
LKPKKRDVRHFGSEKASPNPDHSKGASNRLDFEKRRRKMLKKPTRTALAVKALIEFSDSVLAEDAAFAMSEPRIFRWRSKRPLNQGVQPSARAAQGEQRSIKPRLH